MPPPWLGRCSVTACLCGKKSFDGGDGRGGAVFGGEACGEPLRGGPHVGVVECDADGVGEAPRGQLALRQWRGGGDEIVQAPRPERLISDRPGQGDAGDARKRKLAR